MEMAPSFETTRSVGRQVERGVPIGGVWPGLLMGNERLSP